MKKLINFNKFAQIYTGYKKCEKAQIDILKNSLVSVNECKEISKCELMQMFDKKCEIEQNFIKFNDYYSVYKIIIDGKWACDSMIKII